MMPLADDVKTIAVDMEQLQKTFLRPALELFTDAYDLLDADYLGKLEAGTDLGLSYRQLELAAMETAQLARQCRLIVQRKKHQIGGTSPAKPDDADAAG